MAFTEKTKHRALTKKRLLNCLMCELCMLQKQKWVLFTQGVLSKKYLMYVAQNAPWIGLFLQNRFRHQGTSLRLKIEHHTITHCNTLQHTATHCNTLQHTLDTKAQVCVAECGAVWCSVVQCGAVWCSGVQCVAVWCSVVQCGAVRCSMLYELYLNATRQVLILF